MRQPGEANHVANTLNAAGSVLVLVDYQGRLMPALHEGAPATTPSPWRAWRKRAPPS